ncbi:5-formyltetrahydrofolate cyclo-ligase [Emergencia sp. 1XD21-10]|uniref:5-formyltetrahydrofolate cyclo-ligase n=1 Tax=Emergencia sp. 1XD21-10 TaxID=2304569 RepID=UPI00137B26B3|nr:5-formyltetrahydrofolate cyclo-ligase [Emergencia sp. 1XD21-10]
MNDREQIRKSAISARDCLGGVQRQELSAKISEHIAVSAEFQEAEIIMLYKGVRGEVRLEKLEQIAEHAGKRIVYPLCTGPGEMIALEPKKKEGAWEKGAYGIMEPVREHSIVVSPEDIDLVICPCTAFDEKGNRMGMGAGYYDRFLPQCVNAVVIAAAFEVQKVERLPVDEWDYPMERVFTEERTY